jgi:cytochrome c oxidase subunit 2
MLWVSVVVFVLVIAYVAVAVLRKPGASSAKGLTRAVAASVGATIAVLFVLLVASVWTGRTMASLHASSAVTIAVTGHQWWWEIEYEDAVPNRRVLTANEIHIPVQRPIAIKVTSRDVIHSFWVPNLHGKRDLIPGYTTAIWLQADHPGVFRGQCAEFCGMQHAHMAFTVVAESEADFERWLDARRAPARQAQSAEERHGHDLFMTTRCSTCHAIQGTDAQGLVGPNLTHIGSRNTIAAATLPNTREHLVNFIEHAQGIKPGIQMPNNPLGPADLQALAAYLESLR